MEGLDGILNENMRKLCQCSYDSWEVTWSTGETIVEHLQSVEAVYASGFMAP